jgi:signal transduction histidine kinase
MRAQPRARTVGQRSRRASVSFQCFGQREAGKRSAHLRQIVSNLVSNAVTFSPSGGRVEVALSSRNSEALIMAPDNGEGIEPHSSAACFRPFLPADAGTTKRHGGLGLSLAIVKHLAHAACPN